MIETAFFDIASDGAPSRVDTIRVGDAKISRIPDMDAIAWPATALFGELTSQALEDLSNGMLRDTIDLEQNSLLLSFNIHLVQTPSFTAIVDAGIGNDKNRPDREAWHKREGPFLDILDCLGVKPEEVDIVINTHLHADHVGWNTVLGPDGWQPTFPNARYVMPEIEFAYWNAQYEADRSGAVLHGAFADSIVPVRQSGQLQPVPANCEIAPGLHFEPAFGHSPGMCVVRLKTGASPVLFTADALHHPVQFSRTDLVSNFCADPRAARATRAGLLSENAGTGTILAPYHFPAPSFGRVERDADRLHFVPLPSAGNRQGGTPVAS